MARTRRPSDHHSVYVVYLRNQHFQNHRQGIKAARIVTRCGERLVPRLYAHLNPMPYAKAVAMEVTLAESLRKRGYIVFGGH